MAEKNYVTNCPNCGAPLGKDVGKLDMKCINCNSYFNFEELYKQKIAETIKPQTHADRIRAMTDEELAALFAGWVTDCDCNDVPCRNYCLPNRFDCKKNWLDWLKQEAE